MSKPTTAAASQSPHPEPASQSPDAPPRRSLRFGHEVALWAISTSAVLAGLGFLLEGTLLALGGAPVLAIGLGALAAAGVAVLCVSFLAVPATAFIVLSRWLRSTRAKPIALLPVFAATLFASWILLGVPESEGTPGYLVFALFISAVVVLCAWLTTAEPPKAAMAIAAACAAAATAAELALDAYTYPELHDAFQLPIAAGLVAAVTPWRHRLRALKSARLGRIWLATLGGALLVVSATDALASHWRDWTIFHGRHGYRYTRFIHFVTDVDHDGFSSVLGGPDCAPFDHDISPGRVDFADGIDSNCDGHAPTGAPTDEELGIAPRFGDPVLASPPALTVVITLAGIRREAFGEHRTPGLWDMTESCLHFDRAYASADNARGAGGDFFGAGFVPVPAMLSAEISAAAVPGPLITGLDRRIFDSVDTRAKAAGEVTQAGLRAFHELPSGQPRLLWVHYSGPESVRASSADEAAYLEAIHGVDEAAAALYQALIAEETGATALIVAGLAGRGFADEGRPRLTGTPFDSTLRVPMAFCAPGVSPGTYPHLVTTFDGAATLLGLYGRAESAAPATMQGVSWLRLRGDRSRPIHDHVFAIGSRYGWGSLQLMRYEALVTDQLKLVRGPYDGTRDLYDLSADPDETEDLASKRPAVVRELETRLAPAVDHWDLMKWRSDRERMITPR